MNPEQNKLLIKMKDSQINPYEHSDIKVKLLKLYLEKYINILSQANGVNEVEVFDLFCGEGIYENGKEGSPVIILKLIKEIFYRNKASGNSIVKFNCHYNDFNKSKIEKLGKYIKDQNLHYSEIGTLNYLNENYESLKNKIINGKKKSGQKSFIFIDPYGYKGITIKDIEGLLADKQTEVLLFLPTQFMYRFEKDATPESLYEFLVEVLPEDEQGKSKNGIDFINKLRDGFGEKLKGKHYVDSFIITRDANQYFALFFFTSHLYGFEKFLEAKWTIDEEEGRGWTPGFNRVDLFSAVITKPKTDKFEQNLIDFLCHKRSNIQVHKFTVENRHLITHSVQILKEKQSNSQLDVVLSDGSIARKGSFYIGWNEVKKRTIKSYIKIK